MLSLRKLLLDGGVWHGTWIRNGHISGQRRPPRKTTGLKLLAMAADLSSRDLRTLGTSVTQPGSHTFGAGSSMKIRRAGQSFSRFSKSVYSLTKKRATFPVGPFRCLATNSSAIPSISFSATFFLSFS